MLATTKLIAGQLILIAMNSFLQGETSDFKDLGTLLLVGFVLAVGAGVAFTVIRLRLREKKPPTAQIISINWPHTKR
ncbi:MAG: hypothetical protein JWM21_285 [Acidobacteria bacterium]|nr:hypothetical protein [Acidobacteriota bacterium]